MIQELAAAILRDVPRYSLNVLAIEMTETPHGGWVKLPAVEAALSTALDPALTERAEEVLEALLHEERIATSAEAVDFRNTANLITALLAKNAALRAEAQEMGAGMVTLSHEHSMERARANAAEAERDALRKQVRESALQELASLGQAQEAYEAQKAAEAKLTEWQALQHYSYIGKDGKPVLARDLEDRAEAAEAVAEKLRAAATWAMNHVSKLPMDEATQSEFMRHRAALTTEADNG